MGARHYFFFVCVRFWQSWKLGISRFGILQIIHTSLYNSTSTHRTQEGNMQSYIISCVSVCAPMCFWIICVVLMCSLLVHCVHFNTHQYTYQYTYQKGIYDIHIYIYIYGYIYTHYFFTLFAEDVWHLLHLLKLVLQMFYTYHTSRQRFYALFNFFALVHTCC